MRGRAHRDWRGAGYGNLARKIQNLSARGNREDGGAGRIQIGAGEAVALRRRRVRDSVVSLEHIETVLRRGVAMGISMGNMLTLLLWFHFCTVMENIDPLQGGYWRRKYRKDRRPTMPVESPWVFYPRYVAEMVRKHVRLAQLMWRFHWFCKRLERDPEARAYTDAALSADFEHDGEAMEMLAAHAEHKTAAV
jgi:hypothetical protein